MSVSWEPLVASYVEEPTPQEEIEEPPAPQEEEPPIVEEAPAPPAVEEVTAAAAPAPKKRGRPKQDPAAKAAPQQAVKPPPTPESSDGDEPIDRDDMETLLLDYLVKRKRSQQDARRNMWAQLAGLR